MMRWIGMAFAVLISPAAVASALAQQTTVAREQDIVDLRLGQRIQVDDGTCPSGQIKEILGAKLGPSGVVRSARCVARSGSKS